jgi:hypothetical protein
MKSMFKPNASIKLEMFEMLKMFEIFEMFDIQFWFHDS